MEDRLSSTGKVEELTPEPDISQQFPIGCSLRKHLRAGSEFFQPQLRKVMLFRVERQFDRRRRTFKDSHKTNWEYGKLGRCQHLGTFAHYTMTLQALRAARKKKKQFRVNGFLKSDYKKMYWFMEKHRPETQYNMRDHRWCRSKQIASVLDWRRFALREQWFVSWTASVSHNKTVGAPRLIPNPPTWEPWSVIEAEGDAVRTEANAMKRRCKAFALVASGWTRGNHSSIGPCAAAKGTNAIGV